MRTHHKHVLMCTGPRCTESGVAAEAAFALLGREIDTRPGLRVKRTRTHCFAVCRDGPILVVYPDGIWYRRVDATVLERIVAEHLEGGQPVEEYVFHRTGKGDVVREEQT